MRGSRRLRAIPIAVVGALLAFVAAQFIGASNAAAAAVDITGQVSCADDGSYTVSWSVTNNDSYSETATVTDYQPATASTAPGSATIASGGSAQFDETGIGGTSTGASLTVHSVSSSDATATDATGSVTLDGTCAPSTHMPTPPTGADGDCVYHPQPTITIPTDSGVAYALDGTPVSAGVQSVTTGVHTVTATSSTLTLTAPTSFQFDLHSATGCTATVTPDVPQVLAADCSTGSFTDGALTLPTTNGIAYSVSTAAPYSSGQTVIVTATATPGNAFGSPAPSGWIYVDSLHEKYDATFPAPSGCVAPTPVAPTFADDRCANFFPAGSTYTIPSTVGIDYLVHGVVRPAGTYAAIDGSTLTVQVRAQPGYTLSEAMHFTHRFVPTPMCKTPVVSIAPSFTPTSCTSSAGSSTPTYTVPSTPGVTYTVNGAVTGAGAYLANSSTPITVVAYPDPGYVLTGTTTWSHSFSSTGTCPVAVVPARVHFTAATCTTSGFTAGSYRVPHSTGVVYRVAGMTVSTGRHVIRKAGAVTVIAHARPGYTLSGRTSFTHSFGKSAATCRGTDNQGRHRTAPDSHGGAPVATPASATAPIGLAETGVPVTELLLAGIALLLMGVASQVGAAVRRRGPAKLFDTQQ